LPQGKGEETPCIVVHFSTKVATFNPSVPVFLFIVSIKRLEIALDTTLKKSYIIPITETLSQGSYTMYIQKVLFLGKGEEVKEFRSWDSDFKSWKYFDCKGFTKLVKIMNDDSPESPRSEDPCGSMISLARCEFYSDEGASVLKLGRRERDLSGQFYYELEEIEGSHVKECSDYGFYYVDGERQKVCILPIYMYSHSGTTIKNTPFGCLWDSGLVGYIYMSSSRAKEVGFTRKNGNVDWKAVRACLVSETQTYDPYMRGDVYGFQAFPINPLTGEVSEDSDDSCWGFYGDEKESGLLDNVYVAKCDDTMIFDLAEAN
jgi:hypothetical protein